MERQPSAVSISSKNGVAAAAAAAGATQHQPPVPPPTANPILSHIVTTDGLDRALMRAIIQQPPTSVDGAVDTSISNLLAKRTSFSNLAGAVSPSPVMAGSFLGGVRQHIPQGAAVEALVAAVSNSSPATTAAAGSVGLDKKHSFSKFRFQNPTQGAATTPLPPVSPKTSLRTSTTNVNTGAVINNNNTTTATTTAAAASSAALPHLLDEVCPAPPGVACGPCCVKKSVSFADCTDDSHPRHPHEHHEHTAACGEEEAAAAAADAHTTIAAGERQSLLPASATATAGGATNHYGSNSTQPYLHPNTQNSSYSSAFTSSNYGATAETAAAAKLTRKNLASLDPKSRADMDKRKSNRGDLAGKAELESEDDDSDEVVAEDTPFGGRRAGGGNVGRGAGNANYFVDDEEEEMGSHIGDFHDLDDLHGGRLGAQGIGGYDLDAMRGIRNMSGYFSETSSSAVSIDEGYMLNVLSGGQRRGGGRGWSAFSGYDTVNGADGSSPTPPTAAATSSPGFFSRLFRRSVDEPEVVEEEYPLSPRNESEGIPSTKRTGRLVNSVFTKDGFLNVATKGVSLKRLIWSKEWYFVITGSSWPRLFLGCLCLWLSIGVVITSLYYAASTYCGAKTSLALSIYFNTVSLAANGGYIGEDKKMLDPIKSPKCFELRTAIVMFASYLNILCVGFIAAAMLAKAAAPASLKYRIVFSHVVVAREILSKQPTAALIRGGGGGHVSNASGVFNSGTARSTRASSFAVGGGNGGVSPPSTGLLGQSANPAAGSSPKAVAVPATTAAAAVGGGGGGDGRQPTMLASLVADEPSVAALDVHETSFRAGGVGGTATANATSSPRIVTPTNAANATTNNDTNRLGSISSSPGQGPTMGGVAIGRSASMRGFGRGGGGAYGGASAIPPSKRPPHCAVAAKAFSDLQQRDYAKMMNNASVASAASIPLPNDLLTFLLQFRIGNISQTSERAVLSGELRVFLVVLEVVDMRKRSVRSRSYELPWVSLEEDHGEEALGGVGEEEEATDPLTDTCFVDGVDENAAADPTSLFASHGRQTGVSNSSFFGRKALHSTVNYSNVHSHSTLGHISPTDLHASKTLRLWFPVNACIALSPHCASRPIRLLYNLLLKHSRQGGRHKDKGGGVPLSTPSVSSKGAVVYPYAPDAAFENIFDFQLVIEYQAQDAKTGGSSFVSRHSYGPSDILRKFRFAETCTYLSEATWENITRGAQHGGAHPSSPSIEIDFSQFNVVEPDD